MAVDEREDLGWLFKTSAHRRGLAIACSAIVLAVALWNVPVRGLRPAYRDATGPAYRAVQFDQSWSYFAPEVGLVSPDVWVEVERIDGTVERWDLPESFPFFGTLRRYRWIKFDEYVAFEQQYDGLLDYSLRHVEDPSTVTSVHVVVALTAPTVGNHGPYEPNWQHERVASRRMDES